MMPAGGGITWEPHLGSRTDLTGAKLVFFTHLCTQKFNKNEY